MREHSVLLDLVEVQDGLQVVRQDQNGGAHRIRVVGHVDAAPFMHRSMVFDRDGFWWSSAQSPRTRSSIAADAEVRRIVKCAEVTAGATVFVRASSPSLHALPWEFAMLDGIGEVVRVHAASARRTTLGESTHVLANSPLTTVDGLAGFHAAAVARVLERALCGGGVDPAQVSSESVTATPSGVGGRTLVFVGHTCEEHVGDHLLLFEEQAGWLDSRHLKARDVAELGAGALVLWSCSSRRFLGKMLSTLSARPVPDAAGWRYALATNAPIAPSSAVAALPTFLAELRKRGDLGSALTQLRGALGAGGAELRPIPALTLFSAATDVPGLRAAMVDFDFVANVPRQESIAGINDPMADSLARNAGILPAGLGAPMRASRQWLAGLGKIELPEMSRVVVEAFRITRQQISRRQMGLDDDGSPALATLSAAQEYAARVGGRLPRGVEYELCACGPRYGEARSDVLRGHGPNELAFDMAFPGGATIDLWARREWLNDGRRVGGIPWQDGGVLACLPQVRHAATSAAAAAFRVVWDA